MATITIRNVPDDLHERLKERAAQNRRSLNAEILQSLEQAVQIVREDPAAYLDRIRFVREKTKKLRLTDALLREAREQGRS
jgi:plasmid stability protein